ncbi:MAG TPA: tRNA (adenosine(37)-N6)-dimethylallyltransferase MiaA [Gemmatimonadaceae bacterium]|jgi:tRNA dimethylallyltransferase|nr:tRNA (adenosine(37)-N6)-dimethylallyltransferase MiaA [Gemmatimonadaceae bacterium]
MNVRVIVGPTAAGKSAVAMDWAKREPLAILSADSRQIYRGFDVGTAKPSADDRATVVHYGVDIVDPTQHYSAYQWAKDAAQWIGDAVRRGLVPVIVGGTGFYIKSLFDPPYDVPPVTDVPYIGEYHRVDPGPPLKDHIEHRVEEMFARGWIAEVEQLMHNVPEDAIAWKACGYRNLRKYITGEYTLAYAKERVIIETRQYAKRQRTWFRHQLP